MENKEYGIRLKLDIGGFMSNLKKAQDSMREFAEKSKSDTVETPEIDTDGVEQSESKISSAIEKIKKSFSEMSTGKKLALAGGLLLIAEHSERSRQRVEKLKNSFKKLGNIITANTSKGVSSLKRFALSLFGAQSAYRGLSKAVHAYLAYDSELSKSMQNTWAGLGSFFAPILEYLINLFQKLLGYINAVVKALTGINFVARANEKAMKKTAGATAKANKQFASFDELQNLNQDNGAGGGADANQIELPEIDDSITGKILEIIEKIKGIIGTILDPIFEAWKTKGSALIESIINAFTNVGTFAQSIGQSILDVWTNGTGQKISENFLQFFTDIFTIIGGIAEAWNNAWNSENTGTAIIQSLANIFMQIQRYVLLISDSLKNWVLSEGFQEAIDSVLKIIKDIVGAIEAVAKWVVDIYENYVKPVVDETILPLISDLIDFIKMIWDEAIKPLATNLAIIYKDVIEPTLALFIDHIRLILDVFRGIIQFITGIFRGDFDKAFQGLTTIVQGVTTFIQNAFQHSFNLVWGSVKGIINYIIWGFEAMVNTVIKGLNLLIKPLASLGNTVLKAVGIKGFSFSTISKVSLPRLNIGTDEVLSEGLAYLHPGEKVVPAEVVKGGYSGEDNKETNNLLRQLIVTLEEKDFSAYITAKDIGETSINYINKKRRITGEEIV